MNSVHCQEGTKILEIHNSTKDNLNLYLANNNHHHLRRLSDRMLQSKSCKSFDLLLTLLIAFLRVPLPRRLSIKSLSWHWPCGSFMSLSLSLFLTESDDYFLALMMNGGGGGGGGGGVVGEENGRSDVQPLGATLISFDVIGVYLSLFLANHKQKQKQ